MGTFVKPPPIGSMEELTIRAFLKNFHRGEAKAIAKPMMLRVFAVGPVHLRPRELDELLRSQRAAGFPVAATGAGVFWAASLAELRKAHHYVTSRFGDLRETAQAYERLIAGWGLTALPGEAPVDATGQHLMFAGPASTT